MKKNIEQILIDTLDSKLPSMTAANNYNITNNGVIKGFNSSANTNDSNILMYEFGDTEIKPITEDYVVTKRTLPIALYYKCKADKVQGKLVDLQEKALIDLSNFVNGSSAVGDTNSLNKSFATANTAQQNQDTLQSLVVTGEYRTTDIKQGSFICGISCVLEYDRDYRKSME